MESMVLDSRASASNVHNVIITVVIAAGRGRVRTGDSGYGCDSSGGCWDAGAHTCGSRGRRKIAGRIINRNCQVVAGFGESTRERDVVVAMAAGVDYTLNVAHLSGLECDVSNKFLRIANVD